MTDRAPTFRNSTTAKVQWLKVIISHCKLPQKSFTSAMSRYGMQVWNLEKLRLRLLLRDDSLCSDPADCSMHVVQRQRRQSSIVERHMHGTNSCEVDEDLTQCAIQFNQHQYQHVTLHHKYQYAGHEIFHLLIPYWSSCWHHAVHNLTLQTPSRVWSMCYIFKFIKYHVYHSKKQLYYLQYSFTDILQKTLHGAPSTLPKSNL